MKGLILAGGSAVRFRPFSHSMPKQLIPIANRPVLEYVIGNVVDMGVTEVGVIVGDWAPQIAESIGDGSRFGARITYIQQDRPLGLAHAVKTAGEFLGSDDFVLYLGDNLLPEGMVEAAEEFRRDRPAAQVQVYKVPDPREYGVAEVAGDGRVERLVEKPRDPRSDLAVIGVYFFTAAVHEAIEAIRPSGRGELEITDAIQWLVGAGADVQAREYVGFWKDTGRVDDVLECNRRLLGDLSPAVHGYVDDASELHGRVVIEPGASVVRCRIEGPVIVGPNTSVKDSVVGPNTSIGADCEVDATQVADSIVLDGASISSVPGLRGSLIGRSATVGARDDGAGHRLLVGDDVRVEIGA